jgi:hypothetical protein
LLRLLTVQKKKEEGDGCHLLCCAARCLPGSRVGPAPTPTSAPIALALGTFQLHSHNSSSRLAPAGRLWSSGDGVRVGGGRGW